MRMRFLAHRLMNEYFGQTLLSTLDTAGLHNVMHCIRWSVV